MLLLFKTDGHGRSWYAVCFDDGREERVRPQVAMAIYGLMAFRRLTEARLGELLWPDPDAMPDAWLGPVRLARLRARRVLARGGVRVAGHWGRDGWRLGDAAAGAPVPALTPTDAVADKARVLAAFPDARCHRRRHAFVTVVPRPNAGARWRAIAAFTAPSARGAWTRAADNLLSQAPRSAA